MVAQSAATISLFAPETTPQNIVLRPVSVNVIDRHVRIYLRNSSANTNVILKPTDTPDVAACLIQSTAQLKATVQAIVNVNSSITNTGLVVPVLRAQGSLIGSGVGSSTVNTTIKGIASSTLIISDSSTVVSAIRGSGALHDSITATASTNATIRASGRATTVITAQASTHITPTISTKITAASIVSGLIKAAGRLIETNQGVAVTSGSIHGSGRASTTIVNQATTLATIAAKINSHITISASSSVLSIIRGSGHLDSIVLSDSIVLATMHQIAGISGTINGIGSLLINNATAAMMATVPSHATMYAILINYLKDKQQTNVNTIGTGNQTHLHYISSVITKYHAPPVVIVPPVLVPDPAIKASTDQLAPVPQSHGLGLHKYIHATLVGNSYCGVRIYSLVHQ